MAARFPAIVLSGWTADPPAIAVESVSAPPPKDGIDAKIRRNPAAARAFLTIYPSKTPPRTQYNCLFYLIYTGLSRVPLHSPLLENRAMDPWAMAIPSILFLLSVEREEKFTSAGDPQRGTVSYSPSTRGR